MSQWSDPDPKIKIAGHHYILFPTEKAEILNIVYTACCGINGLIFGKLLDMILKPIGYILCANSE